MKKMWMKKDKRAEQEVGPMIIFIAMVLVAAVAASVMISTANTVREQAQSTGDQAIDNVASGFTVQDVVGGIEITNYAQIVNVTIYMRLSAGSPAINMQNVMISVTTSDNSNYLNLTDTATAGVYAASPGVNFGFSKQLDVQEFQPFVLGQGDLAKVYINGLTIGFNEEVVIKVLPAYGQMTMITFTTPEQYSTQYLTLA